MKMLLREESFKTIVWSGVVEALVLASTVNNGLPLATIVEPLMSQDWWVPTG